MTQLRALLEGVRVLDLSDERGLLAGRILADLGADVVQVEPSTGSSARWVQPREPGTTTSFVWEAYAANKRGVVADLDTAAGRWLVRDLAVVADVVIESSGPGVLAAHSLDWPDLRSINPRLVYVSVTAFGRTGPKASLPAPDLVVWASSGALDKHRDGDRPPVRISLPQSYLHASADAAAGAQLALIARSATGRGQLVDISAQASLTVATLGHALAEAVHDVPREMGLAKPPTSRTDRSGSGSGTTPALKKWACLDGLLEFHLSVGAAAGGFTNNFLRWMVSEQAPVEDFAGLDFRVLPDLVEAGEFTSEQMERLRRLVAEFLLTKTKAQVLHAAVEHKLLCVPIFSTADLATSAQLADREFFTSLGEGPRTTVLPGRFAQVSPPGLRLERPAPLIGEHQHEVLPEWSALAALPTTPQARVQRDPASARTLPLAGLKVVDFSWVVAGPLIGRALADFGATVVRVESSTRLETARLMPPFVDGKPGPESSALYGTCNAGKLGVSLDLKNEDGRQVARDLADWADVVIESFSPGLMARWGLDYQTLSRDHPDLIMLSTSINGGGGRTSRLAGYGNIGAALSGFQAITGWPDREPIGPFGPYTDFVGPRFAISTLLGALVRREATGAGCSIDIAQVESGAWFQAPEIADYHRRGTIVERSGNADRDHAPHGVFGCRPGPGDTAARFVALAVTTDAEWQALCQVIQRPDMSANPSLCTAAGRLEARETIEAAVADWTAQLEVTDAEAKLQAAGVPAHRSASSHDLLHDPQIQHRGHFVHLDHATLGGTTVEGPRYLLSETPGVVAAPAPTLGQHNTYVLSEILGYEERAIQRLEDEGVLR
jgi:crotonobetainyl-CoA:carnitine CoA-transferase CaiB-like acyl-CoA transferase